MNLLLDINLLLIYNRTNEIAKKIENDHKIFNADNNLAVSIVTVGEIKSILYRLGVGERRIRLLEDKLKRLVKIGIDHEEII